MQKAFNEKTVHITVVSLKELDFCECGTDTDLGEVDLGNRQIRPICRECMMERLECHT